MYEYSLWTFPGGRAKFQAQAGREGSKIILILMLYVVQKGICGVAE